MAIEDSPSKRLLVKEIYDWIVNNFPYYRAATGGWRNSVRHNLSLSKSFRRIERDKNQVGIQTTELSSSNTRNSDDLLLKQQLGLPVGPAVIYVSGRFSACFIIISQ